MQIRSFCNIFQEKAKNSISESTIEKLIEIKSILGIPLILYMVLALNISIEKEGSIVDVYDKIFSLEGGIYDRCINNKNFAEPHRIGEVKKHIHQISRDIAIWMFEYNQAEAYIPKNEYQKICNSVKQEENQGKETIQKDFLIGNYFRLVKHCEELEMEKLYFVHRSIYEYFVAETIITSMHEMIDISKEKLAGVLSRLFKEGIIQNNINIINILKYKVGNSKMKNEFKSIYETFQLMLQDGMTFYSGECYTNVILHEMRVFFNMLEIMHLWNDELYLKFDNIFCQYLRYNKYNGINLSGINLGASKEKSNNRMLDLSKGVYLEDVYLVAADLSGADLSRADLKNSDLRKAIMPKINLELADLGGANLNGADLREANLKGANLIEARLVNANLQDADLTGAYLTGTFLTNADLKGVKLNNTSLKSVIVSENQVDYLQKTGYDLQGVKVFIEKTGEMILYENWTDDKKK